VVTEILQERDVIGDISCIFLQKGVNHLPDYILTTMKTIVSTFTVVEISDLIWHIHLLWILNILEYNYPQLTFMVKYYAWGHINSQKEILGEQCYCLKDTNCIVW